MNGKLFIQAIVKFFSGFLIVSFLLFISAGTLSYPNAWIFLSVLFVPMFVAGIFLMIKNPALLEKRLNAKEKENEQKIVIILSGVMFILGFVISGFNYRFRWFILPDEIVVVATIVFLLAYLMYAEVVRENTYLSRTIEVQKNQKVVDTGLYGIVRHPMYSATIILFLSMPLVLGSLFSFFIFCFYPFIIIKRIKNEEQVLEKELVGYEDYKNKVRYRLIPFVW